MAKYTGHLIRNMKLHTQDKRSDEFISTGKGNIVFCDVERGNYAGNLSNLDLLITLYDLLSKYRSKGEFMDNVSFYYVTPNDILFDEKVLNEFYIEELKKRNIKILFNHEITKVNFQNELCFKNNEKLDFHYCHIIPKQILPSFLRYSKICGFDRKNEFLFDYNKKTLLSGEDKENKQILNKNVK
jgi:hypothetical protein